MDSEKRFVGGWFMWFLFLMVIAIIVLSVLGYAGKFTNTVVERKIFEESYQYKEARKGEVALFQAQLNEIETQLLTEKDPVVRQELESKAAAIRVQLAAARAKQ